jgi:D-ribulokinase
MGMNTETVMWTDTRCTAVGIDFGTSGARAIALQNDTAIASVQVPFDNSAEDRPTRWKTALFDLLSQLPESVRRTTEAIALNGTSSTVLLCDAQGTPITAPLLYNDRRAADVLEQVTAIAPADHPVISASSSLAKLLWWQSQGMISHQPFLLHQADWLAFLLHGQLGISDYHNALKLGYDVVNQQYPNWLKHHAIAQSVQLPTVLEPGTPIAPIQPAIAAQFALPPTCRVCAGTTDSIAAFLASGAIAPGDAVTSLGSTLVIKLLSQTRVDCAENGIYSHRFGELWLVGGASNTGGAVLRQFFDDDAIAQLSQQIDPNQPNPYNYYPLTQPGERFPINDPTFPPCLEPRPNSDVKFLYGLLDSMARIEAQGYARLIDLGATAPTRIFTAGGGAQNPTWTILRDRRLPAAVHPAQSTDAAYGTARLAQRQRLQLMSD